MIKDKNVIEIRSIESLLNEKFRVPRYQRGYRWDEQQITELLGDIREYTQNVSKNSANAGKFYCLQPIVVKKANWEEIQEDGNKIEITGWDLIDGQQRLTTLFVLLSFFDDNDFRVTNHDGKREKYSISFETRDKCISFLNESGFKNGIDESNIDFYHISKCYHYIKEWFNDKLTERLDILRTILKKESNVSIIWYEIKDSSDPIEIFKRLNIGKIPLTDAELIKALILQSDKCPKELKRFVGQRLFEIATEWDEMEVTFKDEKFWYFITNDENSNIGIEFIFNILAEEWYEYLDEKISEKEKIKRGSKHFAYLVFNQYIEYNRKKIVENPEKDNIINYIKPINDIWKEVKDLFSVLYEWYNSHTLYHYIGYLITIKKVDIKGLIQLSKGTDKDVFISELREKIGIEVNYKIKKNETEYKTLSEFAYGYENYVIISILLLFNIETVVNSYSKENYRFPFNLYKKEKITSIEHIHPQNPEDISDDEERAKEWLKLHKVSLNNLQFQENNDRLELRNQFIEKIGELLTNYDNDIFNNLTEEIFNFYDNIAEIKENEKHTLYNLALVDKKTNSALNNSSFDVKREILKAYNRERYIPICTMRAFEKYYTEAPAEMMFWNNADRKAYFEAIEKVYDSFIKII